MLAALALCPLAALLIGTDPVAPVARARALIDVERSLDLYVEPDLQRWAIQHATTLDLTRAFYLFAHVPVAGWALIWVWYLRRDRFRLVRDTFLWLQAVLIGIYIAFPVAPPHLVPGTPAAADAPHAWGAELASSAHTLQSPFAAVPSGHVGFALVAGWVFARYGDMLWLRAFGWLYPLLVGLATLVTGNHLWLDLAAGAVVTLAAGLLARRRLTLPHMVVRRLGGTSPVRSIR